MGLQILCEHKYIKGNQFFKLSDNLIGKLKLKILDDNNNNPNLISEPASSKAEETDKNTNQNHKSNSEKTRKGTQLRRGKQLRCIKIIRRKRNNRLIAYNTRRTVINSKNIPKEEEEYKKQTHNSKLLNTGGSISFNLRNKNERISNGLLRNSQFSTNQNQKKLLLRDYKNSGKLSTSFSSINLLCCIHID